MKELLLKVLEPTKVDWKEFTKEELIKLAPTLEGKPVNIDHNKLPSKYPSTVGEVEQVFVNNDGEVFATVSLFDDIYDEIKDNITGCSFEWNPSPSNKESIFKGLALTLNTIPKVDSAKILGHVVASREVENMTESEKKDTEMRDAEKRDTQENKANTITLTKEELEKLISEKVSQAISNIKTEKPDENTNIEASNDKLEALTDRVNDLATSIKTLIKKMESNKEGIEASKLPNSKNNNKSVDICNTKIEFDI